MPDAALTEAESAYRHSMPEGVVEELDLTVLDRTGVPTVAISWAGDAGSAGGTGYGATPLAARVGALGELSEGIFPEMAATQCPTVTGSFTDMCRSRGADAVCDPVTLVLPAGTTYTPSDMLEWGPAVRWRSGETVWVPIEFLASEAATVDRRFPAHDWLVTPITNGLGAGTTLEQAVGHGLLEILQRDGDTVSFRALDQGVVLDVSGIEDDVTLRTLDRLHAAGIEPQVKVAADEFVPVVYCVGDSPGVPEPEPVALSAIGEAAHPDPVVAVRKAVLEFAASRARRIFAFGSIGLLEEHYPEYAAAVLSSTPSVFEEKRALDAMRRWCAMDQAELRTALEPIFRHDSDAKMDDFRTTARIDGGDALLAHLLDVLKDFDVLVMAGGEPPSASIRTAKVLVPGLEVETLSYARIGERVTRRLLERGSDLVGLGPAYGSRMPVRLTDEATERLGGPAWLDRARLQQTLGTLYPLYREPSRHSAPLSLLRERTG